MMVGRDARERGGVLDTRARLALFHGSGVRAEQALAMDEADITFDALMRYGVTGVHLRAAGLGPDELRVRGAAAAAQLRQLGLNSLDLLDPDFCNEARMVYGGRAVADAFVVSPADAVNVAGSEAMRLLDIDTARLLACCSGFPGEAAEVLAQLPPGAALHGVPCRTVLDAGLRADALAQLGYGVQHVREQLRATGPDLVRLGYGFARRVRV